jgi:tetratricopeptide (TPR) repeat protein
VRGDEPVRAPEVAQGRPTPEPKLPEVAELELEAKLRAEQTRMGEAVRVHVSLWRPSHAGGGALTPTLSVEGPAKVEEVGREILDERGELLRERFDFRVEPTGVGAATLRVGIPGRPEHRELKLEIAAALSEAELRGLLRTHFGRLERGRALARQGDYRQAITVFRKALEQRPHDATLLGELGWAAFLAGQYNLGRRATREALRLESDAAARGALLYNLGRIAEALQREDEALAAYRRSLEVRPRSKIVTDRLAKLEAGRPPRRSCAGHGCPLSDPVTALRACELIEEEGCPLFESPGHCRCQLDELDELGPWRLLTLVDPGAEQGVGHVYFLLLQRPESASGSEEPRYQVFPPLLASRELGEFRGGIAGASRPEGVGMELLRIDFAGQLAEPSPSAPDAPDPGPAALRERAWTLLCAATDGQAACAAPLLRVYEPSVGAAFEAPVVIEGGRVRQEPRSGEAPDPTELALDFPGKGMRVLDEAAKLRELIFAEG